MPVYRQCKSDKILLISGQLGGVIMQSTTLMKSAIQPKHHHMPYVQIMTFNSPGVIGHLLNVNSEVILFMSPIHFTAASCLFVSLHTLVAKEYYNLHH